MINADIYGATFNVINDFIVHKQQSCIIMIFFQKCNRFKIKNLIDRLETP